PVHRRSAEPGAPQLISSPSVKDSSMVDARVFSGGTILTVDPARPEAEAVGVVGDRIVAVGDRHDVEAAMPPGALRYDLADRTMIPGFNEAHNHMIGFGETLEQIDCGFPSVTSI